MNKVFADKHRIFLDNWNSAYGNKILHLLFLINFCELRNKDPVMYIGSNLDDVLDFNFKLVDPEQVTISEYFFTERDSFYIQNSFLKAFGLNYGFYNKNLDAVIINHYRDYLERMKLLHTMDLPENDFMIKGHFFDYDLMPSYDIFNKYISLKKNLVSFVASKYPDIYDEKSIAVHYRGTDFSTFLSHLFPKGLQVNKKYYEEAMEQVESKLGNDVTYHLFSDDLDFLKDVFSGKKIVVHDDNAHEDWVAMFLMKNIIQTSSSFCWTAGLYNKIVSVQPKYGYNFHQNNGSIPYGFHQEKSILISGA